MLHVTPVGCRVLLLSTSCTCSQDTDSLERTAATGDHPIQAAKVSTTSAWPRRRERGRVRWQRWVQRADEAQEQWLRLGEGWADCS